MPLYEYECRECGHRFEALVTGSQRPECPKCKSPNLEKQLSAFGVGSSSSSSAGGSRATGGCGSAGGG
jgi:putative FmdB family regulatory protein